MALYGHSTNQSFAFAGLVLTDAVLSLADGNWWSWIEMGRGKEVSRREAKSTPDLKDWPSFRYMRWTARKMPLLYWRPLINKLATEATDAHTLLSHAGNSALGQDEALPSLRYAYREFENTDGSGKVPELTLQRLIRDEWIKAGWGRPIDLARDQVSFSPGLKLGTAGFADLLLVASAPPPTLQVIEVKRAAKPGRKTDGISQLVGAYVPWLATEFPEWTIEPILVALHISKSVLAEALRRGIQCWEFDPDRREFLECRV